jgi:hypothetical protein
MHCSKVSSLTTSFPCDRWMCHRASDPFANVFKMFETGEGSESWSLKGEQLTFAVRKTSEQPSRGWQEDLDAFGAVSVDVNRALEVDESGSEFESEPESDEEKDVRNIEQSEAMTRPNKRRKKDEKKGRATTSAVVKKDSKVSFQDIQSLVIETLHRVP